MAILEQPLHILNASAGSGKTFSLVRNYLKLLLQDGAERAELGQIVAMTFTNKASLEMKTRILGDLGKLSGGEKIHERFLNETAAFIGLPPEAVVKNSRLVLRKLLHQYENFNVMTIDKFNLRLIKSFSRDLNLPEQFEVIINKDEMMERSIDELLQQVDAKNKGKIYRLAMQFSKEKLRSEGSWNIRNNLSEKSGYLLKEANIQVIDDLVARDLTPEDEAKIKEKYQQLHRQYVAAGIAIFDAYRNCGWSPDQFSNKSRTTNPLEKCGDPSLYENPGKELYRLSDAVLQHLEKTNEKLPIADLLHNVNAYNEWLSKHGTELIVLKNTLDNLPSLRLLRELAVVVDNLRERESAILVAEFNQLVSQLVKNEEAPFIYERLGARYKHFFLDEFQDTSFLQWHNLVPMVHESLGHRQFNFIVGDPKQSIYRFKNGVAEQFVCLPYIYNPEENPFIARKSEFFHSMGTKDRLEFNWRSAEEIVKFNNLFFSTLKPLLPESGQAYYNDIQQTPKGKPGGYVKLEYDLSKGKGTDWNDDTEDDDITTINEVKCVAYVKDAIADGYLPGEICILAKQTKACLQFANALKKEGFQVVSADSLLVDSDETVRLLVHYLSWRNNPLDVQKTQLFASAYFNFRSQKEAIALYNQCFQLNDEGKSRFSVDRFYAITSFDKTLLLAPFTSIYSCLERVSEVLSIDGNANSYVKQLFDIAFEYDKKYGPSLGNFLSFYKDKGNSTNVQVPENSDAIKIMTAHKSKGLEFPVVIVPSLNNDASRVQQMILPTEDFFIETSVSAKAIERGIATEKLEKEINDQLMDAVNLLYVMFTRPVDRLYIFEKIARKSTFKTNVLDTFRSIPGVVEENEQLTLEWGTKPARSPHYQDEELKYAATSLEGKLWFPEISLRDKSNSENDGYTEQIRLGKQFHWIMERSESEAEALQILEEGIQNGACSIDFKPQLAILLNAFFTHAKTQELFAAGRHLNERTLIVDENKRLRPDKLILNGNKIIILDFKTGEPSPKHDKQVQEYAAMLERMGYEQIEGYLYYSGEGVYREVVHLPPQRTR